jgi:hypothetical protein
VKIEYAFETARLRIYLPSGGETWFFVDKNQTVKDFLNQCKSEDSYLKEINIVGKNHQQVNQDAKVYDLLTGEGPLFL